MFETYNTPRHEVMAITSMQAIKLHKNLTEDGPQTQNGSATQGSAGQSLTMGQAEKMMKTLVEEGWLEKSIKGFYSLSPRALMELRGWLWETYNELDEDEGDKERASKKIKQCFACKEIITTVSRTAQSHVVSSIDFQPRVNDVRRRAVHAVCTIYVYRTFSELRAQRSALYAKQTGRVMTSLVRERLCRRSTSLRRGGAVAEPWPEGHRLWLWRRMRKWMRPKNRKTTNSGLRNAERRLLVKTRLPT